nr:uncharacterized protein LOC106688674 isoform X2 [Halyomorpha halys]
MFGMYEVLFISIIILKVMVSCSISVYRLPSIHIPCYEDDNCNFGMLCSKNRTCICSRLYDWNEELKQCQLNLQELGLWLSSLKEETDLKGEFDAQASAVFFQVGFTGIFAISLGLLGGLVCVYCFCFQKIKHEEINEGIPAKRSYEEERKRNIEEGDAGMMTMAMM